MSFSELCKTIGRKWIIEVNNSLFNLKDLFNFYFPSLKTNIPF